MELTFEDSHHTLIPDEDSNVKCFQANGEVSGKATLTPPAGKTITHTGVYCRFQLVAEAAEQESHKDLYIADWCLLGPGKLREEVELPFSIDLSKLPALPPSYRASQFQLAYYAGCVMNRPWWTFPVTRSERIYIEGSPQAVLRDTPATGDPEAVEPIVVDDFGAVCTLTHDKGSYFVESDSICGRYEFVGINKAASVAGHVDGKHELPPPIHEVALILGRTEIYGPSSADFVVRRWLLHTTPAPPITSDTSSTFRIPLSSATTSAALPVRAKQYALDETMELLPTLPDFFPVGEGVNMSNLMAARNWLRLELVTSTREGLKSYWNTHPVTLLPTQKGVWSQTSERGTEIEMYALAHSLSVETV